jgi:nucleoside 2-deoxyribosyltransferase
MRITICGSISSSEKMIEATNKLIGLGHTVELPYSTRRIMHGELTTEEYLKEIEINGDKKFRKEANIDVIKEHYEFIKNSDAILVVNTEKNDVKNYIGGNVLMEIGFAYVLGKKIFLLNPIPEMGYKDEIMAMQPMVLNGDLNKIN